MRPLLTTTLAFALLAIAATGRAQDVYTPIEQRLDAAQLQATGLGRLSAQELTALNAVLRDERTKQIRRDDNAGAGLSGHRDREPVESRINGSFRGWSVGTTFELENGQVWSVVDGELYTKAVTAPKASIKPGMLGSWYMDVEGQPIRAKVRRIK